MSQDSSQRSSQSTDRRPDRVELFAFYYLGFNPEGEYRFANAHHVAKYYRVSHDAVLRWLKELKLDPRVILLRNYDLARSQVDLQLDAHALTVEGIMARAAEILEDIDQTKGERRPWEDRD